MVTCELQTQPQTQELTPRHGHWTTIRSHPPQVPSDPHSAEGQSLNAPVRSAPEIHSQPSRAYRSPPSRPALSVDDHGLVAAALHDLRSPLTIVSGRLQLLQMQVQHGKIDPARIAAQLEEIAGAVAHMTTALDTLSAQANREE